MKLTRKQEDFALQLVAGAGQAEAYRAVYGGTGMTQKTIHEVASRLAANHKVVARVAALMQPAIEKAQLTREQWIMDGIRLYRGDVRKLVDLNGNAVPVQDLEDSEADCIEGFELVEDFTKVKGKNGEEKAEHTGYTKKIKFTSKKTRHEHLGKCLGFLVDKTHNLQELSLSQLVEQLDQLDAERYRK